MSVQPIRLYLEPVLNKPVDLITDFTGLDKIAEDLIDTMLAYKGIGLAANQIGLNKNIAVLYLENKTKILVVTNLIIMRYSKEVNTLIEGCLSCPGVNIPVTRASSISVECQKLNGEKINLEFTGYDARIVQHEVQHLFGKLIINNLMKL